MTYGICLWGNTTGNHLRKAQIAQNIAARYVTSLGRTAPKKLLMDKCKWMDIQQLTTYHSLLQLWETFRWGIPKYMSTRVHLETDYLASTAIPRLQQTAASYCWKTVSVWNSMPLELRTEMNISRFKYGVKRWVKEGRDTDDG